MEAIPVVDLRLLTQAEINALSGVSSSSAGDPRRCDDVVVPKIDRSVFNESAGSRKQTYSRLRLAPRKPPELYPPAFASPSPSSGATRGRRRAGGLLHPPPPSAASTSSAPPLPPLPVPAAVDDPCRRENEQIILFLRQLFAKKGIEIADKAAAPEESAAVPSAVVITNPTSAGSALGKRGREQEATEAFDKGRELMNISGMAADMVGLGEAEHPFEPELRRRTHGLVTEEDFLSFLSGLEGQWGSRRKRRRIVDADKLGDALPKGWKILLALKRKEGNIWIHCRRYISPSGKQFMSCKEVSSYLLSFGGSNNVRQQNTAENNANKLGNGHVVGHNQQISVTSPNSSFYGALPISALSPDSAKQIVLYGVENSANSQLQDVFRCLECTLTFADKGAHIQHLLTLHHRSSRKRRRFGQSISDGVIIRDGKYECQFCHKIFTERRRYNGHVGMHVKYHDRRFEEVTDEVTMDKNVYSSTDAAAPAFAEHKDSVECVKETKLTEENVSTESTHVISDCYPYGNEHDTNTVSDHPMKCCNSEEEKIMVQDTSNIGAIDEIKDSSPLRNSCDNDKEHNVIQECFPSPKHEKAHGSPWNSVLVEDRKDDDVMNCSENGGNLVQEVYKVQCAGERNANFLPSNKVDEVDSFPESNNETFGRGIVETYAGMLDQKPRDAAEGGNIVNHNIHNIVNRNIMITKTVSDHSMKCCNCEEEKIMVQDTSNIGAIDDIKDRSPLRNSCDNEKEQHVIQEFFPLPKHEKGHGSPGNNVLVEERKDDDVMNCSENGGNSVQEVYKAQYAGERNSNFLPSNKVKKVDSFPESNNEASGRGIVVTDAGMLDQKPRDAAEGGNIVNHKHIQDYSRSSVGDVGNCTSEGSLRNDFSNKILLDETERPSKLNIDYESNAIAIPEDVQPLVELLSSSQSVIDGCENSENKICPGSNLKISSAMEQSNKRNTVAVCMTEELVEMSNSDNEPRDDLECAHTASDRAAVLENIMPGETQLFLMGERFFESSLNVPSGRKFCNVDTTVNDLLPSSGEKIVLEMMGHSSNGLMMGHSSNGLKDDFMNDGTVHADAQRNDTGITDDGNLQSLQVNLQTSWEQASVHLPIFQMITDQGDGRVHSANGNHGDISCFEDMRLDDDIDPQKLAGPNSRQQLGEPTVGTSGLGNGPCVHLDWDTAFRHFIPRRRFATVCVWCSTEFEHDDVDIEVQPDSVGFMCPTCKAKISGQM